MVTYPEDWDESKLLDHVMLIQGLTYTPENVKPSGTLVLRSSNIQNGRLSFEDNVYVNVHVPEEKMVEPGDILICVRNGSSALIGKSCILPKLNRTTFGAFMSVLRGDVTGYFAKLFESNIVQEQVRGRSNATINQITKKDFQSIVVTVPSLPEQEKIARTLSTFDTYINDLTELIEKKKGIRDGALEDLVSGRTRLAGFTETWRKTTIGECAEIFQGGTPNTSNNRFWGGQIIWVTPSDITKLSSMYIDDSERKITEEGIQNSSAKLLPPGTILLCTRATIGALAIASKPMTTNQGFKNLVCRTGTHNVFLAYLLQTLRTTMISLAIGTTFLEISKKNLSSIEIKVPPFPEQKSIADILTSMDEEIEALETERDKMIQIREGAMDDLLTGRVRLPM